MQNIEPSVQTLYFTSPDNAGYVAPGYPALKNYFIDLSQVASLVNRRFYRQGLNWAVAGIKCLTSTPGTINISKLPNTWVLANSWEKTMRTWMRMNNEALAEAESVRPRFLDFKIYANDWHHAHGSVNNMLPGDSLGNRINPGEWEYSKIVVPDTTLTSGVRDREILGVGPNYPGVSPVTGLDAVSIIEGYAASRALPNIVDPNTPNDALSVDGQFPANWLSATFNDGTQQIDSVITDMVTENNQAPYPFEDDGLNPDTMYPGGANQVPALQMHDYELITSSTIGGTTRLKGGNFPCGLMMITVPSELQFDLIIDLIPGSHRGYLCETMTEM